MRLAKWLGSSHLKDFFLYEIASHFVPRDRNDILQAY